MNKIFMALLVAVYCLSSAAAGAYTREEVAKRGALLCGVATGSSGFSSVDAEGRWTGLDVDFCRAVAAATLGDANLVNFLPLADNEAFTALLTGEVDILSRHASWTFARDAGLAVNFAGIIFHDGLGIMVRPELKAEKIDQLKRVNVCQPLDNGESTILFDYLDSKNVSYKKVPYESFDLAMKGFDSGACDLISHQRSQLIGISQGPGGKGRGVVFPETFSRVALGPVVRQGDDQWLDIVRWTLYVMIDAEHLGVNSSNVEEKRISNDLATKRLLGMEMDTGRVLGLSKDWVVQVIRQVGNYGEVFARNLGPDSTLKMERGLNRLWDQGGLLYAPLMR